MPVPMTMPIPKPIRSTGPSRRCSRGTPSAPATSPPRRTSSTDLVRNSPELTPRPLLVRRTLPRAPPVGGRTRDQARGPVPPVTSGGPVRTRGSPPGRTVAARGPLAQLAEQRTFNPTRVGSSPTRPTARSRRLPHAGRHRPAATSAMLFRSPTVATAAVRSPDLGDVLIVQRPRTPPFQGGYAGSNPVGGTHEQHRTAAVQHDSSTVWEPPGPVAQLVSAPPCHGGGRGFESRRGRSTTARPAQHSPVR